MIKKIYFSLKLALCIPQSQKSLKSNSNLKCSQSFEFSDTALNQSFSRQLTVTIPAYTQNNGTLMAYVFLGPKSLLKTSPLVLDSNSVWPTKIFFKELALSKYKQNRSDMYVNLLQAAQKKPMEDTKRDEKNERPITHLLTNINVNTMDSNINFDRFQIPGELYSEIR